MATHMPNITASHETSPAPLTEALIRTLEDERNALLEIDDLFEGQIDAIIARDIEAIEEATYRTNVGVTNLESIRKARLRQTKLLARVLGIPGDEIRVAQVIDRIGGQVPRAQHLEELKNEIVTLADRTLERSEDVAFLLQHGLDLNQEMMQAAHTMSAPPPNKHYTAKGASSTPAAPSLVNRLG
jgi:hypothetical protein